MFSNTPTLTILSKATPFQDVCVDEMSIRYQEFRQSRSFDMDSIVWSGKIFRVIVFLQGVFLM